MNGWPWFLVVRTNKTKLRIVIPDRELGWVNFLILSRRLAGGKNITEESLCLSSYIGSYGRWLGLQFWEVVWGKPILYLPHPRATTRSRFQPTLFFPSTTLFLNCTLKNVMRCRNYACLCLELHGWALSFGTISANQPKIILLVWGWGGERQA